MAKQSSFWELLIDGCVLATSTFRVLGRGWRPNSKTIRTIHQNSNHIHDGVKRNARVICIPTYIASSIGANKATKHLYLVRWKACWTLESKMDDVSWIPVSLAANQNPHCRRSERLAIRFEDRKKKHEKMMVVVKIG